ANFIKTDFQANQNDSNIIEKQNDNEIIENDFREVIFEGRASFFNATFKARVCFRISQFKEEVRFIETQFQAEQSNNETIENDFREVIFEGRAFFFNATFKARVSFALSQFKSEANFIKTDFQANQNDSNIIEKQNDNEIIENDFREVIFEGGASFSNATFKARVSFVLSQFKEEVRFIKTQFLAKQSNNETIENDFREVIFEGRASFSNATFKARVSFGLSQFKEEVRFIKTEFQANQNDSNIIEKQNDNEIIENDFREVIFEGRASFSNVTFKARVSFGLSQFKSEANFIKTDFQANQNDSDIIENQFLGVIFAGKAIFNNITFQARVNFTLSQFKDEVRFAGVKFQAEQSSNRKIIENEFREVVFKGKVTFDSLVLKARIGLLFSTFKDETLFLNINPNNCI
ncbi:TPA: hypothetical protein RZH72_001739, partial [Campylobacter coli]|nr:hypothetical protein [Campylobacter coli]